MRYLAILAPTDLIAPLWLYSFAFIFGFNGLLSDDKSD